MTVEGIGQQTRKGLSWNLASAVVINGMRLVVLVVLGRLLDEHDFGIVAAAVSVNTIVYSIRDVGIGPALIQRQDLKVAHLSTAFAVSVYLGVLIAIALLLAAPLIGEVFHVAESIDVIRVLALLFVLRNISVTSRMMLRRAMNFRALAMIDTLSFSAGAIASIACAAAAMGPWALVIGYVVEELLLALLQILYSPPKMSLTVNRTCLRELLGFGGWQTVMQVANTGALYGDNVVIGHGLGTAALGFYSRAYDLVKFPAMVFDMVVGNVLFPAFSRLQTDKANLAAGYRRATFLNALLMCPAAAALLVLAPETIRILVGSGWEAATVPFQILSITVIARSNHKLSVLVAQAAGAVRGVAVAMIVYMLVVIGGGLLAVRWGIAGVAFSTTLAIVLVTAQSSYVALQVSSLPMQRLLGAYLHGVILALLVAAIAWPLATVLRATNLHFVAVFGAVLGVSISISLIGIGIWLKRARGDFAWLGAELRSLATRKMNKRTKEIRHEP